jgi:hypothetical protein
MALTTNIGELTVRNLLAAATLCLGLATPALASVELSSEQLDSVAAGTTLILNFVDAAFIPAYVSAFQSQGWTVTQSGNTLTAMLGPASPTITVTNFVGDPSAR